MQVVQKDPVTITPITIPIKEDILPLGEDQDTESQVSMEAVTTVEVPSQYRGSDYCGSKVKGDSHTRRAG